MNFGWLTTSLLHTSLLVFAIFNFSSVSELKVDDVKPVAVEIISKADIEQVGTVKEPKTVTKRAEKQPLEKIKKVEVKEKQVKKDIPKPKPKPKPKPTPKPVVKPAPKPAPKPVPKPEPVKKPDAPKQNLNDLFKEITPAPEKPLTKIPTNVPKPPKRPAFKPPVKKVEPKPEPKKVEPKKASDQNDQLSALLNNIKVEDENLEELDLSDLIEGSSQAEPLDNFEPVASLSQFEFNQVRNHMRQCWSVPAGAQDVSNVVVKVGFELDANANVIGTPRLLNSSSHPSFAVLSESAIRAVLDCAPYTMLPADKHDVWKEFSMEFDPSSMF